MYSPVPRPVIVYSPFAFVVAQPAPTLGVTQTRAPASAFFVNPSVTVPVISPPACRAALMADVVAPALTDTDVASGAVASPL